MTVDFSEIVKRKLYKQSGASVVLTIGLPVQWIDKPDPVEGNFFTHFPEDMVFVPADRQFFHYFSVEKSRLIVEELLKRMEKDPKWVQKRIREFQSVFEGLEADGNALAHEAETFSSAKSDSTIALYERFLEHNRTCWTPSAFVDLFDPFEERVIEFVFDSKAKTMDKQDIQTLLTPEQSVFWTEKEDLEAIRKKMVTKKATVSDPKIRALLNSHAEKYWWIQNDYEHVQRLTAGDFAVRLDEKPPVFFWNQLPLERKKLIQKHGLDSNTQNRLQCVVDMAVLRDVRKKFIQMSNFFIVTFFHETAKRLEIPVEWSDFVVPFRECRAFLQKDPVLLKELESRTKTGVWLVSFAGKPCEIESKRSKELLELVERNRTGGMVVYGNSANLGKAVGPARIVLRQSDFGKFREGDVLVTGMTRPEFVPLMKKACAIVTDEGGITSHAAIASRELNKPCVIGTQVATKAFKDGDWLEVNANHGFVKKTGESK